MGFPKLGTNFSNYLNLAVEFGFYFLQEKIIVSDRLGHLSLELHMLGRSQAVSLDSGHSPHFRQPRIEVLQLRWWILKLLLWMDLVLHNVLNYGSSRTLLTIIGRRSICGQIMKSTMAGLSPPKKGVPFLL